jgi:hyperosmotically inducible protein
MSTRAIFASVLVSTLLLASGCQGYFRDSPRRTAGEVTDDRGIHTAVKSKLISHGETRGWKINVDVFRSVVTLRGYVLSEQERAVAIALAQDTRGVKNVDDKLVVLPPPAS